jgi:hypothetical protein
MLLEFPDVPVYPPIDDPYASLIPAGLAAFGMGPSHAPDDHDDDDDNEEEAINDDEDTKDDEKSAWRLHFFESFPFLMS